MLWLLRYYLLYRRILHTCTCIWYACMPICYYGCLYCFLHQSEGRLQQVNTVVYHAYMYHVFLACDLIIKVHIWCLSE